MGLSGEDKDENDKLDLILDQFNVPEELDEDNDSINEIEDKILLGLMST